VGPIDRSGPRADHLFGALALSADGSTIAARAFDGLVSVWRLPEGALLGTFGDIEPGSGYQVNGVALSGDGGRLAAIDSGAVRVWDLASREALMRLDHPDAPAQSVALSPDGQLLAAGLSNGLVQLSATDGGSTRDLVGHTGGVASLTFSADGALLVSGSAIGSDRTDGTVRVWRTSDGGAVGMLPYPGQSAIMSLAFAPDGKHLAGALLDGTVRIWPVRQQ